MKIGRTLTTPGFVKISIVPADNLPFSWTARGSIARLTARAFVSDFLGLKPGRDIY